MIEKQEEFTNEKIEVELFLEALYRRHGYDFRKYSKVHIKRRIDGIKVRLGYDSISRMIHDIMWEPAFKQTVLHEFSINYTEMFRDPKFYNYLRNEVIDLLKTFPFIKIWHAGCSTGEEVYSLAIMLKECGLYDKTQIYATDFNDKVLRKAEQGIYPLDYIKSYTQNYQQAGGLNSFSDYYVSDDHNVVLNSSLREKIVFANHNLTSDGVFGEIHLILCRNVLIYFNKELQDKVLNLFRESLCNGGIMCLGSKETLKFTGVEGCFNTLSEDMKTYQLRYDRRCD